MPGLSVLNDSIARALTSGTQDTIEIYREEMDLSRFGTGAHPLLLRDYLRAKYASKRIEVVVAALPASLDFMLAHGDVAFPNAAIVFCGVDARESSSRTLPVHATGVYLKREFGPTLELAIRLHPDTRQIVVVSGTSNYDVQTLNDAKSEFSAFGDRFSFTYLNALPLRDILDQVSRLPPRTIVLYTSVFTDGAGEHFVPHQVAEQLVKASNAPVYGFLDQFLDRGLVGGHMYSMATQGEAAAKLALMILAGSAPSTLSPLVPATGATMFNWQQLKRWGIDESRLPPGSEIRFRSPSLWDQYRWQLIAVTAALLLQAALIAGLLFERRRRRLAEIEARHRVLEVAHLNRTATAGVMSVSIAHELNQPLGAILLNTDTVDMLLKADSVDHQQIKEVVAEIRRDDQRAAQIIKGLSGFLKKKSDVEIQKFDLNDALAGALHILEPEAVRKGVELKTDQTPVALPVRADPVHLQQVILNLAINGMDAMQEVHGTRSIAFRTTRNGTSEAMVSVSDNGPGVPEEKLSSIFETFYTTKQHGSGLGLSIARTIVGLYGGKLWAENRPNGGAVFFFTLPLSDAAVGASS